MKRTQSTHNKTMDYSTQANSVALPSIATGSHKENAKTLKKDTSYRDYSASSR
jgi:hypothetical protein